MIEGIGGGASGRGDLISQFGQVARRFEGVVDRAFYGLQDELFGDATGEVRMAGVYAGIDQGDRHVLASGPTLRLAGAATASPDGRYTLTAPLAGTVVRRPAVVGLYATESESLATLADTAGSAVTALGTVNYALTGVGINASVGPVAATTGNFVIRVGLL